MQPQCEAGRFPPYGECSILRAFEMLGFGVLCGLGYLSLVPAFRSGRLERAIALVCGLIGLSSLAGAVGYTLDSTTALGLITPAAWGLGP